MNMPKRIQQQMALATPSLAKIVDPKATVAGLALLLIAGSGVPVYAGPFEACLEGASDARASLAACREAETIYLLSGRDTKRSNFASKPSLPPSVRTNRLWLAELNLARARYLVNLGDVAGARKALARARDVNPGVRD